MSDYSQITFFTPKDGLATGNPNKIIYGSDVDAELSAISTAIATKADVDGDAIGAGTPATELSVDNLKLDANKIISTNTDGDIELEPNGAGYVVITNADINAGNIDNTVIGATTAAAITGTTLTANTSLALATGATVTAILDEDAMTSNSATALATQQSIKAYVDSQVTAQDLDVTTDSGTIAIDLDSETLTVAGGTGLDTSATGNTVTVAIDSTVATLTGTQTLTNKTLTSPDINTPDIDGGTIDGVTIGGSSAGAGTFTNLTATGTTSLAGASTSADITFGDNDKAIFGAGSDLQIYHNGTQSRIMDVGTGDLSIWATNFGVYNNPDGKAYLTATSAAEVKLYYDNSTRLTTTATGIDVTGTVKADGLRVDGTNVVIDVGVQTSETPALEIRGNNNTANGNILRFNDEDPTTGTGQTIGKIEFYSTDVSAVVANIFAAAADVSPDANIFFQTAEGTTLATRLKIANTGDATFYNNVTISGSLSKGSGSFKIDHPVKPDTHHLVHSFIEGPQADNIYRGKVDLVAGTAAVNIDTVAGMIEGTFVLLNREVQCFTSNETGWTAVRGKVDGNILTIEAQDPACTDTISWMVVGERQDPHMYDTEWTDENGKVIVEPLKETEGA